MTTGTSIRAAAVAVLAVAAWTVPYSASTCRGDRTDGQRGTGAGDRGDRRFRIAVGGARHRQIGGPRFSARHQGRAGGQSQDRQRRDPLLAPRLHHRQRSRPDQHVFLRRRRAGRWPASTSRSTRDLNGIRAAIRQLLPDADIRVEGIGDGVILTGTVASQAEAQQAYDSRTRRLDSALAAAERRRPGQPRSSTRSWSAVATKSC